MTVLKDETFKKFRDFIYEQSGIFIPDTKKYFIENRLSKRLEEKNLCSYDDYLYMLKYSANKEEMKVLFDKITTNETFFFREVKQLEVFVRGEAPRLIARRKPPALRVWCAASSTGEEPYTLAMMLMENPQTSGVKFDILASDISDSVLQKAQCASYGQYAMRNVPDIYLKKYFKLNGNSNHHLSPVIKSRVRFSQINLLDEKRIKAIRDIDAIFCRNVLIYFDKKAKVKVIENLYETLRPGGCLFIGMAESLHDITRLLKPMVVDKTVVYQKT
ncbi:CheR family methyltransferase [Candidatus Magnetominusculus dajiuhuensis]|uniref:CheR family methyltransferase n=1 Tax=Candidatus Magnetominusculus dajiuhuensis TaxID=3137712 RepID=UPI003B42DA18